MLSNHKERTNNFGTSKILPPLQTMWSSNWTTLRIRSPFKARMKRSKENRLMSGNSIKTLERSVKPSDLVMVPKQQQLTRNRLTWPNRSPSKRRASFSQLSSLLSPFWWQSSLSIRLPSWKRRKLGEKVELKVRRLRSTSEVISSGKCWRKLI